MLKIIFIKCPGFKNEDEKDFAPRCRLSASPSKPGCGPENAVNGVARETEEGSNVWESQSLKNAQLTLAFDKARPVGQIQLTFDPNLTREIMPSITSLVRDRQCKGLPEELVKDYTAALYKSGQKVWEQTVAGNSQRVNLLCPGTEADELRITVSATHGHPAARIFEVRLYEKEEKNLC